MPPKQLSAVREYILVRHALWEAIEAVESTADSNLPHDPQHDNQEEKRLRQLCHDRIKEWKHLLAQLGGKVRGEKSIGEEFASLVVR